MRSGAVVESSMLGHPEQKVKLPIRCRLLPGLTQRCGKAWSLRSAERNPTTVSKTDQLRDCDVHIPVHDIRCRKYLMTYRYFFQLCFSCILGEKFRNRTVESLDREHNSVEILTVHQAISNCTQIGRKYLVIKIWGM